ncbi:MAG: ABC transporter ATP-binding protein [Nitrososphaerota archaeon]|jgi:energy-coupling factor transporter ATP-binding protein EcfA2|nr:ABC transporter ATP-binding protein [Nitrososphaerota archaeon]MDG6941671.1 ABC transporter ATP-binding protein [Nitrososphaerota archaeon]MDG6947155.1 ABC transporter ATP-binding protein [Nitrososphaerota archaeon]
MGDILEVEGLSFKYSDAPRNAVSGFNLAIPEGEIVVLAGPSGCGKSTLLRTVNGLIPHMYGGEYSGDVRVGGSSVKGSNMRDLAQSVGFLFQNPENQIFMFTVERDVAFGLENLGVPRNEMRARVDEALGLLRIGDLAQRAPHELSDGQKQRVALAGVLAMRPKLVILDEPTSLLDPRTASELVALVVRLRKELGTTFVVVEHRLDLLMGVADRLVVMEGGKKVAEGTPKDVLFGEEVGTHGVAVPAVTRVQKMLAGEEGVGVERLLTPSELAAAVEGREI